MSDDKVWQEFYCGECQGYIRIRINMNLNCEIEFECPNCGHKHRRVIRDGVIKENGRFANEPKFELTPMKSAYSKEPWTKKMRDANGWGGRRDGAVVTQENARDAFTDNYMHELWFERYGGKESEDSYS